MKKIAEMISTGEISAEDLLNAKELIERAEFVKKGLAACKKTILFPFGVKEVQCYYYLDSAGEYKAWGVCSIDGNFTCFSNWGGEHKVGECNLTSFEKVFMAFENNELAHNLHRFLQKQIEQAIK